MKKFIYLYQDGSLKDDFSWTSIEANSRELADIEFRKELKTWNCDWEFEELEKYLNDNEYLIDVIELNIIEKPVSILNVISSPRCPNCLEHLRYCETVSDKMIYVCNNDKCSVSFIHIYTEESIRKED